MCVGTVYIDLIAHTYQLGLGHVIDCLKKSFVFSEEIRMREIGLWLDYFFLSDLFRNVSMK